MAMPLVGNLIEEGSLPPNTPDILPGKAIFTASGGHSLSFEQEDGVWVATVDKNLPQGFSSKAKLPVHCAAGFSVETLANYSPKEQQNLIHVEQTTDGQAIVYLGKVGLMGGGKWSHNMCSTDGCRRNWLKCNCGWRCFEGTDGGTWGLSLIPFVGPFIIYGREIANAGTEGASDSLQYCELHCSCVCTEHIVLCPKCHACPHCSAGCKQCCGCSGRIAAEKERERKRREEEERERMRREEEEREKMRREKEEHERTRRAKEERERKHREEEERERMRRVEEEREKKRRQEEERRQKAQAARDSFLAGAMGMTSSVNADTSASFDATHTTVNRQW